MGTPPGVVEFDRDKQGTKTISASERSRRKSSGILARALFQKQKVKPWTQSVMSSWHWQSAAGCFAQWFVLLIF